MEPSIQAVYEHGVLRPLQPLDLNEQELVSLAVVRAPNVAVESTGEERSLFRQRNALLAFSKKMEAMNDDTVPDGLSNRDHDRLIYGS